jgi:hypothetical protein
MLKDGTFYEDPGPDYCGGPGCSDSFFGFLSGKVIQLAVVAVGM